MKNCKRILTTLVIFIFIISTMAVQTLADSDLLIPSNLQVTAASNTVTLTWDAVPGAEQYYIAEVGIQSFTVDAPATSYTVTGLQPGTSYSFRVMAVNSSGNSDWCDPVAVTTIPAIPSNLQVTAACNAVTLTCDAVPGAEQYYIAKVGIQSFTVDAPATSYTVTGLQPGTSYSFCVMAVNSSGNSDWCDPVTVTTVQQVE
ncbi:MAG TPA: fibronectin type III domain-containing protein [Clostridia bacterium]|nr:fibronectin type III domain-containing protein [Clostridia bacterium]